MRTKKQNQQLANARKNINHRIHSEETKRKIGIANSTSYSIKCDYCYNDYMIKPSKFAKQKRHFCSMACYSKYRKEYLPKQEQHAYKDGGMLESEKRLRIQARTMVNHAVRDGKLTRGVCECCGFGKTQAHHPDYNKPLEIKWLCRKCHWQEHILIYENPELLNQ